MRDVRENAAPASGPGGPGGSGTGGPGAGSSGGSGHGPRSGMKFIKQQENVKEISSLTLSPNKRFLAVCERHRGDPTTYIALYDIKLLFKQGGVGGSHGFKERLRINVAELYPPGMFAGGQAKDLGGVGHHSHNLTTFASA